MSVSASDLETQRDAVFAAMTSVLAGKTVQFAGRAVTRSDLGELREQYEWLTAQISRAGETAGSRMRVVKLMEPT